MLKIIQKYIDHKLYEQKRKSYENYLKCTENCKTCEENDWCLFSDVKGVK